MTQGNRSTINIDYVWVKLKFSKPGKDKVWAKGVLALPLDWAPEGLEVTVDVGGVIRTFILNAKGKGKTDTKDTLSISGKKGKFKLKIRKGDYAPDFADERLLGTETVKKVPRVVLVNILMEGTKHSVTADVLYTAKAGKKGTAK